MTTAGKLRVPEYPGHILEAIRRISFYVDVEDMTEVQFLEDAKTQDAVIRNLEVIGEACRNIDAHHSVFAQAHPEIPWAIAYEMRNALAHGYFKVDLEIVWNTIQNDLPNLASQIEQLLSRSYES